MEGFANARIGMEEDGQEADAALAVDDEFQGIIAKLLQLISDEVRANATVEDCARAMDKVTSDCVTGYRDGWDRTLIDIYNDLTTATPASVNGQYQLLRCEYFILQYSFACHESCLDGHGCSIFAWANKQLGNMVIRLQELLNAQVRDSDDFDRVSRRVVLLRANALGLWTAFCLSHRESSWKHQWVFCQVSFGDIVRESTDEASKLYALLQMGRAYVRISRLVTTHCDEFEDMAYVAKKCYEAFQEAERIPGFAQTVMTNIHWDTFLHAWVESYLRYVHVCNEDRGKIATFLTSPLFREVDGLVGSDDVRRAHVAYVTSTMLLFGAQLSIQSREKYDQVVDRVVPRLRSTRSSDPVYLECTYADEFVDCLFYFTTESRIS
jgi:hypothetical protein